MKSHRIISWLLSFVLISGLLLVVLSYYPQQQLQRHTFDDADLASIYQIPSDQVMFADEQLPLSLSGVQAKRDAIYRQQSANIPRLMLIAKRATYYMPLLTQTLADHDIPSDLVYLAVVESSLDPRAVSQAGAVGLRQFLPQTAREFGLRVDDLVDERLHVEKSTIAAASYLARAYQVFDSRSLAAASFNRGVTGIKNLLADQGSKSYFALTMNSQTGEYIYKATALKYILQKFDAISQVRESGEHTRRVEEITIQNSQPISTIAKERGVSLEELRTLNPWILTDMLPAGTWHIIVE